LLNEQLERWMTIITLKKTRINLKFRLDRDVNGAARGVRRRSSGPCRPNDQPTLQSDPIPGRRAIPPLKSALQGELYDAASTVLSQKLSQIDSPAGQSAGDLRT
jgi:multidrug efflux pump